MKPWMRMVGSSVMVLLLLGGCAMVAYARWTVPIADGDEAALAGNAPLAFAAYAYAEKRFDAAPPLKRLFASEYERIVANQLRLLYGFESYDEIIEKAARSPEGANPHFWAGAACFQKAALEPDPSVRLAWFTRATEELRRALEAEPDDWDTKYNLEMLLRVVWELRRRPQTPPGELMQLLRPDPASGSAPTKKRG
ncbi:MAG: hypothetical protein AB1806_19725 [Acidobacteriota bacterium]